MNNHKDYEKLNSIDFKDLPAHWKVKRFKYLTKPRKELTKTGNEELLSVTEVRGIVKRRELKNNDENLSRSEDLTGYRHVKKGDLVSNIMLVWKRGLGVSPYNGIVSPAYSVFTFSDECYPDYYNYLVRSEEYIAEFRKHSTGITMSRLRLYDDSFGRVFAHVPPIEEQKLISRFLDKKIEKIDRLVEKIQKKIKLLSEKRASLINQCIIKGLDLNVKMKDSGFERVGEIPKHWMHTKISYVIDVRDGTHDTPSYVDQKGVPLVTQKDIYGGVLNFNKTKLISKSDHELISKRSKVVRNDIIMSMIGSIGYPTVIETNKEFSIKNLCLFKTSESNLNPFFLKYSLESTFVSDQLELEKGGGVQSFVSLDTLRNLKIFIPSRIEQDKIADYIKSKVLILDNLLSKEYARLNLFFEYRQSLISKVVTGKVNVSSNTK